MPVYEYTCEKCHKTTEALRKMADSDAPLVCEHCGSEKTKRAHSLVAAGRGQSLPVSGGHVHSGSCGCGKPRGGCGM